MTTMEFRYARGFAGMAMAAALLFGQGVQPAAAQNASPREQEVKKMPTVQFITLDPGHFHASLLQKEMYPNVSSCRVCLRPARSGSDRSLNPCRVLQSEGEQSDVRGASTSIQGPIISSGC